MGLLPHGKANVTLELFGEVVAAKWNDNEPRSGLLSIGKAGMERLTKSI